MGKLIDLGTQIRVIRQVKNITQQELAEKSNLSLPYINQIENNHRNVSVDTLHKILTAMDVSLSEFFLRYSYEEESTLSLLIKEIQKNDRQDELIENLLSIIRIANNTKNP